MKTLVTGGAGLVGSHLVSSLLQHGRDVIIADDFSRGSQQNLLDLGINKECLRVDLRYFGQALKITEGVDTVFHLAARVGSVDWLHGSKAKELESLQTNMAIDVNLFRACVNNEVGKIVYASSVSVYPIYLQHEQSVVLSEDDIRVTDTIQGNVDPEGGYGWAKLMGELQLSFMKDTKVGIARIFNTYGDNAALGQSAHVVQALISKAIRYPQEEFVVWGDGKQTRDFLYVSDCVKALLRLEEQASVPAVVVNVGSDKEIAISTLAQAIRKISGKTMEIRYDPSRPVGPISRTADVTKARRLLGWKGEIDLEDGLKRTYSWIEKRLRS